MDSDARRRDQVEFIESFKDEYKDLKRAQAKEQVREIRERIISLISLRRDGFLEYADIEQIRSTAIEVIAQIPPTPVSALNIIQAAIILNLCDAIMLQRGVLLEPTTFEILSRYDENAQVYLAQLEKE